MDRIYLKKRLGPGPIEVFSICFVCPHLGSGWSGLGVYQIAWTGFLIIKQVLTPPKAKFWIAANRILPS